MRHALGGATTVGPFQLTSRERRLTVRDAMTSVAILALPIAAVSLTMRSDLQGGTKSLVVLTSLLVLGTGSLLWAASGLEPRGWRRRLELPLAVVCFALALASVACLTLLFFLSPVAGSLILGTLVALVLYLLTWV
jgi:hypothetical protein